MKGLLFYDQSLQFICPSIHAAYHSKLPGSEANRRIGPIPPCPFFPPNLRTWTREELPHFLLHYLLDGSYFINHKHLSRRTGSQERRKPNPFLQHRYHLRGPHNHTAKVMPPEFSTSETPFPVGHYGPEAKSLKENKGHLVAPCTPAWEAKPPLEAAAPQPIPGSGAVHCGSWNSKSGLGDGKHKEYLYSLKK